MALASRIEICLYRLGKNMINSNDRHVTGRMKFERAREAGASECLVVEQLAVAT